MAKTTSVRSKLASSITSWVDTTWCMRWWKYLHGPFLKNTLPQSSQEKNIGQSQQRTFYKIPGPHSSKPSRSPKKRKVWETIAVQKNVRRRLNNNVLSWMGLCNRKRDLAKTNEIQIKYRLKLTVMRQFVSLCDKHTTSLQDMGWELSVLSSQLFC